MDGRVIIWSKRAELSYDDILLYYSSNTKRSKYGKKLHKKVTELTFNLLKFPELGKLLNSLIIVYLLSIIILCVIKFWIQRFLLHFFGTIEEVQICFCLNYQNRFSLLQILFYFLNLKSENGIK
jgi:hypothetical protein